MQMPAYVHICAYCECVCLGTRAGSLLGKEGGGPERGLGRYEGIMQCQRALESAEEEEEEVISVLICILTDMPWTGEGNSP